MAIVISESYLRAARRAGQEIQEKMNKLKAEDPKLFNYIEELSRVRRNKIESEDVVLVVPD